LRILKKLKQVFVSESMKNNFTQIKSHHDANFVG